MRAQPSDLMEGEKEKEGWAGVGFLEVTALKLSPEGWVEVYQETYQL